jgi:uncharacterized protein
MSTLYTVTPFNLRGGIVVGTLYRIALVLVIVGAINWGLIGFFRFDLVAFLFGSQSALLSRWVYSLVGIAGLIVIPILAKPLVEDEAHHTEERTHFTRYSTEASDEFGHYDAHNQDKQSRD